MDSEHNFKTNFVIAGFGNPLLDICATVNDNTLLDKFNLSPDGQKEVEEVELKALLNCLYRNENEVIYCAGGAVQNTLRIIQCLIKIPSFTIFFGSCGLDKEGEILLAQVESACVETRYAVQEHMSTGTVISLINGHKRSLVAHLGAANKYTLYDFYSQDNVKIVRSVSCVYIEGFFLSHSFNVALEVVKISRQNGNVIMFNLSGAYLFDNYSSEITTMVALADIVVGNRSEFLALANYIKIEKQSIKKILSIVKALDYVHYLPKSEEFSKYKPYKLKQMKQSQKIVICTDGENPVYAIHQDSTFVKVPVPHLEPSMIKDTTGAGDAFVAGFVVGFIMENSFINCLEQGCKTAQRVIQSVGCSLSDGSS